MKRTNCHCERTNRHCERSEAISIGIKIVSILIVATFVLPNPAFARRYEKYNVLPDYDWKADAVGFVATVATPFIPMGATAIGGAIGAGAAETIAIGATMGAGLNATPGLISGNDTGAIIGGVTGGLTGGLGTAHYISPTNVAVMKVGDLKGQISQAGGSGSQVYATLDKAEGLFAAGNYGAGSRMLSEASQLPGAVATGFSKQLSTLSTTLNPMQQYATNVALAVSSYEVSSNLAKAGTLSWGMSPEGVQALSMVGGSVTGWTMASATPGGQQMLKDMYQEIHPKWAAMVDKSPMKVGLITGLGLGSLQTAANLGINEALEHTNIPASTKYRLASMGGTAIGSVAWGGVVGGLGREPALNKLGRDLADANSEYKRTGSPQAESQINDINKKIKGYGTYGGMRMGINSVADRQFRNNLIRQTLSTGLSYAAEASLKDSNDSFEDASKKQSYASVIGSTGTMLLSNLPIWPNPALPKEDIKKLNGQVEGSRDLAKTRREEASNLEKFADKHYQGIENAPEELQTRHTRYSMDAAYAEESAEVARQDLDRYDGWHFDSLRPVTNITKNETIDIFLEPVIYGGFSLAATKLSGDKSGVDATVHNLATRDVASIVHSGIVTLVNKQGGKEFAQISTLDRREFTNDTLSFGTRAFGAETTGRKEEAVGASNIYGAAQRNQQLWDFAGVSNFALQVNEMHKQVAEQEKLAKAEGKQVNPVDWRFEMTKNMSGTVFSAMGEQAGSLARYHTIRNMEEVSYTAIKTAAPYDLQRVNPALNRQLKYGDALKQDEKQKLLLEVDRWVKESSKPAYTSARGIEFPGWIIGEEDGQRVLENTIYHTKYPLTAEVLRELNVNRPFDYVSPASFGQAQPAAQEVKVTPVRADLPRFKQPLTRRQEKVSQRQQKQQPISQIATSQLQPKSEKIPLSADNFISLYTGDAGVPAKGIPQSINPGFPEAYRDREGKFYGPNTKTYKDLLKLTKPEGTIK